MLGPAQCVKDPAFLWLWCRPVATAPIQYLAWELPYATGMALKRQKIKKISIFLNSKKKKKKIRRVHYKQNCPIINAKETFSDQRAMTSDRNLVLKEK